TEIGIDDGFTSKTKPHSAIRIGDTKHLHFYESEKGETYDLEGNQVEKESIADQGSTRTVLFEYLDQVGARMPEENPDFIPAP
ncbi:MAG: hypothetical protein AAGF67_15465, partial [Verrucomicrobiota bacterium]